jgi:RNA polymerase sigma-70 factor, ECF subfamily
MGDREPDYDTLGNEFASLFRRHHGNLYGYILSLIPDIAAADEIIQDTSLRLWEQFGRFDRSKDFGAWARTIAYYQVLKYRKKIGRERLQFDSELLGVLADRVSVRCDELAVRQNYLVDCLAKLSDVKRQIIQLYYSLGMTTKRVAQQLGRNVAGVEKALARARGDLRQCIDTAVRREGRS